MVIEIYQFNPIPPSYVKTVWSTANTKVFVILNDCYLKMGNYLFFAPIVYTQFYQLFLCISKLVFMNC